MNQILHVVSDIQWGFMPELSIIIPCFNEQKGIALFIHKLQKLRPQCEVILVDGGSDDKTVQIAEPFVDLLYIHLVAEQNKCMLELKKLVVMF